MGRDDDCVSDGECISKSFNDDKIMNTNGKEIEKKRKRTRKRIMFNEIMEEIWREDKEVAQEREKQGQEEEQWNDEDIEKEEKEKNENKNNKNREIKEVRGKEEKGEERERKDMIRGRRKLNNGGKIKTRKRKRTTGRRMK